MEDNMNNSQQTMLQRIEQNLENIQSDTLEHNLDNNKKKVNRMVLALKVNELLNSIPFHFKGNPQESHKFLSFHSNYSRMVSINEQPKVVYSLKSTYQQHNNIQQQQKIPQQPESELEDFNIPDEQSIGHRFDLWYNSQPQKTTTINQSFQYPTSSVNDQQIIIIQEQIDDQSNSHLFRNLIFSPTINKKQLKKQIIVTYRGLKYVKDQLTGPSSKIIQQKKIYVQRKNPQNKFILFDLDETLVHCSDKYYNENVIETTDQKGAIFQIPLRIRPYTMQLLQNLKDKFDIGIFTASKKLYAEAIARYLDPNKEIFLCILNRNNCLQTKNGFFIKDLRILENISLKDVVLIDNLSHSFGFQVLNGIPIKQWEGDPNDTELQYLYNYLVNLEKCDDVRIVNQRHFKLDLLLQQQIQSLKI